MCECGLKCGQDLDSVAYRSGVVGLKPFELALDIECGAYNITGGCCGSKGKH